MPRRRAKPRRTRPAVWDAMTLEHKPPPGETPAREIKLGGRGPERRTAKADRRRSAYAQRERDTDRMVWIKSQPCCAPLIAARATLPVDFGPCDGVVEADHAGARGLGRKAGDDTCIPLCVRHHRAPGLAALLPASFPRGELRDLKNRMIARFRGGWESVLIASRSY